MTTRAPEVPAARMICSAIAPRSEARRKKGGKTIADQLANSVIHEPMGKSEAWGSPGAWVHDGDEWERARQRMGGLIETMP